MNRRLLHIIIIFCIGYLNMGISQNNPFNIEGRENVIDIAQDSVFQEAANVFDRTTNPSTENASNNPFEVSHIPLTKADVKKKKTPIFNTQDRDSDFLNIKFWILSIAFILFALIMFLFRDSVLTLYKPVLNENYLKTLGRESNGGWNFVFFMLYLLFFITLSLFIYTGMEVLNDTQYYDYLIYIYVFLGLVSLYAGKHLILAFTGYVYPFTKELRTYNFTTIVLHSILGIFLLFINLIVILGPDPIKTIFLYFGAGIIGIFFLLRLFKGFSGSSRVAASNLYYFFLYLCTSEIAPLMILYGIIMRF